MEKTGEILRERAEAVAELGTVNPELRTRIRATEEGVVGVANSTCMIDYIEVKRK